MMMGMWIQWIQNVVFFSSYKVEKNIEDKIKDLSEQYAAHQREQLWTKLQNVKLQLEHILQKNWVYIQSTQIPKL